jgi:hypothetical protein
MISYAAVVADFKETKQEWWPWYLLGMFAGIVQDYKNFEASEEDKDAAKK